jgi:uncharacterized tellurite resistance protein B-like protein
MSVLSWLGLSRRKEKKDAAAAPTGREAVRHLLGQLDALDPELARYLSLFAYLLARVADVDLDVSEAETRQMECVVGAFGQLPPTQATLVVELAKAQNRLFGATENHLAAREFAALATEDQKRALLHCLFAVSAADDAITVQEEEAIRVIGRELGIGDEEYILIRRAYRDKRAVLKECAAAAQGGAGGRVPDGAPEA